MDDINYSKVLLALVSSDVTDGSIEKYLLRIADSLVDNFSAAFVLLFRNHNSSNKQLFYYQNNALNNGDIDVPAEVLQEFINHQSYIHYEKGVIYILIRSEVSSADYYVIKIAFGENQLNAHHKLIAEVILSQAAKILINKRRYKTKIGESYPGLAPNIYPKNHLSFEYDIATDTISWSENISKVKFGINLLEVNSLNDVIPFLTPRGQEVVKRNLDEIMSVKKRQVLNFPIIDGNGNELNLKCFFQVISDLNDKPIKVVGALHDITYKSRVHVKLEESELKFQHLAEGLDEVLFLRTNEKILYVSPSINNLLEVNANEFNGKNNITIDFVHEDDIDYVQKHKDKHQDGRLNLKYRIVTPSGIMKWIWIKSSAFKLRNNETRFIGIITDITEQKLLEEKLLEEKNRAINTLKVKDRFLSMMSHEIRTPISTIISFNEALPEHIKIQINKKLLTDFLESSHYLNNVFNDILFYTELSSNVYPLLKSRFLLSKVIQAIKTEFKSKFLEKGLILDVECNEHQAVTLKSHFNSIYQVLYYLLSNSLKYTSSGGAFVYFAPDIEKSLLKITLEDTGVGILAENIEKVFKPFFTTNNYLEKTEGGTGLGLAIVKELVSKLKGEIEIVSKPKQGTKISLHLPVEIEHIASVRYLSTYKSNHVLFKQKYIDDNIEFAGIRLLKYLKKSKISNSSILIIDWSGANTSEVLAEKEWINTHFKKVIVIINSFSDIYFELPEHWIIEEDTVPKYGLEKLIS
ncbi:PAS domain-containing sensor histidine kinase [Fulvivirga sp. 29W222]|uniref:histidine kinase n=1 Tax=Fulvivirga marina TaxID=2494733 RepID=A0A937FXY9_9BACT|nr:PAS domain-containing sensor histidine kinase [Fulvivirga marina]MBL6447052.1 PAS domain-containing sensor histidine kinase [Fulvivirga marina]